MASAAGLYMLDADGEPEPEVYVAAAARNQAGIVLGQARSMVSRSPLLLDRLVPHRYTIECPRNGGIMRSLSSDAALQHGLNPSANIVDELHAHKSAELYTALTTGTGAREQPFTLWITTAGVAGEGILAELFESMFTGSGELEDRGSLLIYRDRTNGTLIYWYGAPRDADIEDPAVWYAANPVSWLHDGKYLGAQFARLRARGALLEWRRYHLNQFVGFEDAWLRDGAWRETTGDLPLNAALPIGVGIDRSPGGEQGAIAVAAAPPMASPAGATIRLGDCGPRRAVGRPGDVRLRWQRLSEVAAASSRRATPSAVDVRRGGGHGGEAQPLQDGSAGVGSVDLDVPAAPGGRQRRSARDDRPEHAAVAPVRDRSTAVQTGKPRVAVVLDAARRDRSVARHRHDRLGPARAQLAEQPVREARRLPERLVVHPHEGRDATLVIDHLQRNTVWQGRLERQIGDGADQERLLRLGNEPRGQEAVRKVRWPVIRVELPFPFAEPREPIDLASDDRIGGRLIEVGPGDHPPGVGEDPDDPIRPLDAIAHRMLSHHAVVLVKELMHPVCLRTTRR
jgi:hypothetical protein